MKEKAKRNKDVKRWRKKGYSYEYLGKLFGISRQRAHQIDHKQQDGFWARLFDRVYPIFSKD